VSRAGRAVPRLATDVVPLTTPIKTRATSSVAAADAPASASLEANGVNTADQTNYSFATVAIGAADPTRVLIIGVGRRSTSGDVTVSSFIVDGSAATSIGHANGGAGTEAADFFAIPWPNNTTATIAVNHSGGIVNCSYSVYAAYNLLNGGAASDVQTGAPAGTWSNNVSVPDGGIIVGFGEPGGSTALPTVTWAGITEDVDAVGEGFIGRTSAHGAFSSGGSVAVSITLSAAVISLPAVVASFR